MNLLVFLVWGACSVGALEIGLIDKNKTEDSKESNILAIPSKVISKVKGGSSSRRWDNDPISVYKRFVKASIDHDVVEYDLAVNSMKSDVCKEHTKLYIDSLRKQQEWALKMYDSTAKDVQGYLTGSRYELGDFDECVNTQTHAGNLAEPLFTGQYCLAEINKNNDIDPSLTTRTLSLRSYKERSQSNLTIHWGICLPSTCSYQDVARFLSTYLDKDNEFNISLSKYLCSTNHEIPVNKLDIIYGCIIFAFVSLTLLATLVHSFCLYSPGELKSTQTILEELIVAFSITNNLKKIFTLKHSNPNNLDFIGGIRTIAMIFVIAGHSLIFSLFGPNSNEKYIFEALQQTYYTAVSNSQLLVETFLLLSGLLMAYMFLIELDKRNGHINFIFVYIGRYIRLTPAFIVVIGFYCTWMVRTGSGPLWKKRMFMERDRCVKSWWANILYINNYVSVDNLCMFQSWYLSVDTQLFIIAPFLIYPLWKWAKWGRILLGISTIFTIVVSFMSHLLGNLDPTILVFASELPDFQFNYYFLTAYIKTHVRAFSYFLGLVLGYTIYVLQKTKVNLRKPIVIVSWILAILIGATSLSSIVVLYDHENRLSTLTSATYSISSKLLWNCSIGWMIIACLTGNGGVIYKVLTLSVFQPLARLTYCAFLTNGFIVTYGFAAARHNVAMNTYELGTRGICHVLVSFFLALVLCVLFESPIHGIERILLRSGKRKESSNTTTETVQEI